MVTSAGKTAHLRLYSGSSGGHTGGDTLDDWLDTYRAAGRPESTIRTRRSYVATMMRTLDPLTATPEQLTAYLAGRRLGPEARKSMIVALRSYYRWAFRRGLIDVDMSLELPSVTVPRGVPKPVPYATLARARVAADRETLLILDLGALAGLRRHEIAAVHSRDVTDAGLIVKGKGGRERVVPLHPRLDERLRAVDGWVFPSPVRRGQHVSPDYVSSRVERVLQPYTCHSLRHYFATEAFRGSHDLRAVQELCGHASVETTQRYVLVDQEALEAAVRSVA